MDISEWKTRPLAQLCHQYPQVLDFFAGYNIDAGSVTEPLPVFLDLLDSDIYQDLGLDAADILENLERFLAAMEDLAAEQPCLLDSLTISGGQNKSGEPEDCELTLFPGTVTCIVGPTGSGKSRLLADIEWMAQGDTPTGRKILLNGKVPDQSLRFSLENKLVAQLSQNMNFVMDTSVEDFIAMHAESRMIDPALVCDRIIAQANELAGEQFSRDTPVTSLSGGQSRALMIADTAFLSRSPVVLIDEIENAGIDRKQALSLLVGQNKIVLMSTHDPILALMGERRLVIRNGGIDKILETSEQERDCLTELEQLDFRIQSLRQRLRSGERITAV